MTELDVSIIVCTWNRAHLLRMTLDHLARLRNSPALRWELLIVDNNSNDDTRVVVAERADRLPVRYIFEPLQGLSRARNRGVAEAKARLLLFTDDDVRVDPDWLTAFHEAAARHPRGGAFGGPVLPLFEVPPDPDIEAAYPAVREGLCGVDYSGTERVIDSPEWVVGANFGLRRDALVGLSFDERLGCDGPVPAGGEEIALQESIRKRHWEVIWTPSMRVQHYIPAERVTVAYLRRFVYHRARSAGRVTPLVGSPTIFGVPRWLWFHYARSGYRLLRSIVAPTRAARLTALHDFDRARGMLRGSIDLQRDKS